MTGGIIQLVATGVADLYLTGNPQINWFKSMYRRHTEFGCSDMNIKIPDIQFGTTHYITIPRDADLLNKLTLVIDLPSPSQYIRKKEIIANIPTNRNIIDNTNIIKQITDTMGDYIIITPEKTKEILNNRKIVLMPNDFIKIKYNSYTKINNLDEVSKCLIINSKFTYKLFTDNFENNVFTSNDMYIYNPYKIFANIFKYSYTNKTDKIYNSDTICNIIQQHIYNVIHTPTDDIILTNEINFYNELIMINHRTTDKQYNPTIKKYFIDLLPNTNTQSYTLLIKYIEDNYNNTILNVNINKITNELSEYIIIAITNILEPEQKIYYANIINRNKKFRFLLFNKNIDNKYDFAENIIRNYLSDINNIEISTYNLDDIKDIFNALGIKDINSDKKYFIEYISSSIFVKLYTISDVLYNYKCPYYLANDNIGNFNSINIQIYLEKLKISYNNIIIKKTATQIINFKLLVNNILKELVNIPTNLFNKIKEIANAYILNLEQETIDIEIIKDNIYVPINIDTRKYLPNYLKTICYKYNDFNTYTDIENLIMFDTICTNTGINFDIHNTKNETELYDNLLSILNTNIIDSKRNIIINTNSPKHAWIKNLGYNIIEEVSLITNGIQIETQNGELMLLHHKLFDTYEQKRGIDIMMGNVPELYTLSEYIPPTQLYIKFNLFFCKDYGNSLPLINMPYSNIQIKLTLAPINKLLCVDDTGYFIEPKIKCSLLGTYIYLSSKERIKLTNKYQTLIECYSCSSTIIDYNNLLNLRFEFNNPCKYLLWKIENISGEILQIADTITIEFNSQIREESQKAIYYQLVSSYNKNINPLDINEGIYAFCLHPEQLQPSGTTNMSCIKNINFNIKLNNNNKSKIKFTLWACTYNIFVISSGLAGLLFI